MARRLLRYRHDFPAVFRSKPLHPKTEETPYAAAESSPP